MIVKGFSFIVIIYLLFACNEEVNYRAPFNAKPILYCAINADSNTQFVMLKKSFYDEHTDGNNYIKDAKIKLIGKNKSVELLDTTINHNGSELELYYTKNFKPGSGEKIKIKAELSNGNIITSSIVVPALTKFYIDQIGLIIPPIIDPQFMYVSWTLRNQNEGLSFLPRLTIHYKVNKNNTEKEYSYEIPSEYIVNKNEKTPIYPLASRLQYITYWQKTINTAFMEISKGDPDKSNYTIRYIDLEVYIMEENLAAYSTSIESFNKGYSVKIYEPILSNIEGGLGVFGAYIKRGKRIPFDEDYITSFGYNFEK